MAVPGALTRFIARIERAQVDTADLAFWHKPGRLADLVVDNRRPNGAWWLYKWYGDMAGFMARDGVARRHRPHAGGARERGPAPRGRCGRSSAAARATCCCGCAGWTRCPGSAAAVHARVRSTTWTGTDGAAPAPAERFEGDYRVRSGSVTIPLSDMELDAAYSVVVTPAGTAAAPRARHRYEAESARLRRGRIAAGEQASNGRYARLQGRRSSARFAVSVPAAGPYALTVRYADPGGRAAQRLVVNGRPGRVAAYEPTADGEFASWTTTVNLTRGRNTLRLRTLSGAPALDYLDLHPFRTRIEAEAGTVTDGRVNFEDPENFFANHYSGDRYVAFLVNPDSAVELPVTAPAKGAYELIVGYSNGTGALAPHGLAVNGTPAGEVSYRPTQFWGLIGTVTVPVELRAGANTVRLSHAAGIADLDFVDLVWRGGRDVACYAAVAWVPLALLLAAAPARAQASDATAVIRGDAAAAGKPMSDRQYGIFFEDINHGADGGLYPELVQNRSFEFNATDNEAYDGLTAWSRADRGGAAGTLAVASDEPLNAKNLNYLRLTTTAAGDGIAIRNRGFNSGVYVEAGKRYDFSFFARRDGAADLPVRVAVEDAAGTTEYAGADVTVTGGGWKKYEGVLTASATTTAGRLALIVGAPAAGTHLDLDMVSLFPQDTFKGRENGMRKDLAEKIAAMHPRFLRFPGGCIVNAASFGAFPARARVYDWKDTIGPLEERPTNRTSGATTRATASATSSTSGSRRTSGRRRSRSSRSASTPAARRTGRRRSSSKP